MKNKKTSQWGIEQAIKAIRNNISEATEKIEFANELCKWFCLTERATRLVFKACHREIYN